MSDEMLLAGFRVGDPELSVAFVRRFQPVVYGAALSVLGDPVSAEDVAQRSFEQAWRRAATYDNRRGSVRIWLAGIARHEALGTVQRRVPTPSEPTAITAMIGHEPAGWETDPEWIPSTAPLRAALHALPLDQARAVLLAAVHGYTAAEIAEQERVPLGTAKTRLRAAVGKLRDLLLQPAADGGVSTDRRDDRS
ncbi:RNA polymerase sigma factor [Actinomycetospora chiangmaiensis]|uniref:RNA polymerase sigma factor n=1 Tax=Actinomycetospora chiangmaiensis TaxID=402650 RepID=UPI0004760AEB|nr:sigma-70 family RNA polymerase sigma factor [Actinomycetospora chiangmaiensis]